MENKQLVKYYFKTKPFKHQIDALDASHDKKYFALFMEMGTGKSKVLIDNIVHLYSRKEIDFALIIAPKGVYRNWVEREIPQHLPDDVSHRVIRWVSNPNKEQEREIKSVKDTFEGITIFVMNVEIFSTVKGRNVGTWLAKKFGSRGIVAVDESTTIKNSKSNRTKALVQLSKDFEYSRILTGSPVTNSPMDVYSQTEFLKKGVLGYSNFYAFQARYANLQTRNMGSTSFRQVVGFKNLDELNKKLDDFSFRVLKKDCLDLPNKVYMPRYVSLTKRQLELYEQIRKEALVLFEDGRLVSAPQMVTQMLRLQQILSGYLTTDDGYQENFDTKRIDALLDICYETSGKIIVWSRFRYDIMKIAQVLSDHFGEHKVAKYFGDTKDDQRSEIVDRFQDPNSDLRFFIGNPSTAGRGLTLTEGHTVVYYANDFNLDTRIQSEDRCHRIGQNKSVTYIDLISEGTIDEKIVHSLVNKIDLSAKVLGEEAKEWLQIKPKKA